MTEHSLVEQLQRLAGEAADVFTTPTGGATEYGRNGSAFAALATENEVELRLGPEIAEAARRTPDTRQSRRGAEWVRFAPRVWDQHAVDRLDAWFRVAYRASAERRK